MWNIYPAVISDSMWRTIPLCRRYWTVRICLPGERKPSMIKNILCASIMTKKNSAQQWIPSPVWIRVNGLPRKMPILPMRKIPDIRSYRKPQAVRSWQMHCLMRYRKPSVIWAAAFLLRMQAFIRRPKYLRKIPLCKSSSPCCSPILTWLSHISSAARPK